MSEERSRTRLSVTFTPLTSSKRAHSAYTMGPSHVPRHTGHIVETAHQLSGESDPIRPSTASTAWCFSSSSLHSRRGAPPHHTSAVENERARCVFISRSCCPIQHAHREQESQRMVLSIWHLLTSLCLLVENISAKRSSCRKRREGKGSVRDPGEVGEVGVEGDFLAGCVRR